jgi:glutaredoxin 3
MAQRQSAAGQVPSQVNSVAVTLYGTTWCPYCARARQLLASKGIVVTEIDIDDDGALREQMMARSGRRTVPQIFIGNKHVGGCDDLYALEDAGKLDELLKGAE